MRVPIAEERPVLIKRRWTFSDFQRKKELIRRMAAIAKSPNAHIFLMSFSFLSTIYSFYFSFSFII
jgi:hypothetical protein